VVVAVRSLLLGIDVSPKRLGWGLVDLVTGEPVACGCKSIDLPDHGWMHQQVFQAFHDMIWTADGSMGETGDWEIQCVFIEDTAQAGKYRQHDAGRAQGIVQAEVERRWPHAGLKGNAHKIDVWEEARSLNYCIPVDTQDAADALLIAVAGQRRNGETWERGAA
jgi:hypothetical protein